MTTPEERAATAETALAEALARVAVLEVAATQAQRILAMITEPNTFTSSATAWAQCVEAEARLRAALRGPGE